MSLRRREFIAGLSGAVAAWPLAAGAQQPRPPVVGYIGAVNADASAQNVAAFLKGLSETGYINGQNVAANNTNQHCPTFS
jgi:putative ABC transport system substrate-binding protein